MVDTVGFRVRNQDRVLQIDGTYTNMEFKSKGTLTPSQQSNDILGYFADVQSPSPTAVIAVVGQGDGVYVKKMPNGNFRVYAGRSLPSQVTPFTYYIFDKASNTDLGGGFGFVVRSRITGQVVFNSNRRYLRILDMINATVLPDESSTFSYPGKSIAPIQCRKSYYRIHSPGGAPNQPVLIIGWKNSCIRNLSTSSFNVWNRGTHSAQVGGNQYYSDSVPFVSYIVVDVTGL
ncbi:hypothetical protein [Pseudomonas phage Almagne]|nr:hypothetical protein [Pseudomonas phage Almagne]